MFTNLQGSGHSISRYRRTSELHNSCLSFEAHSVVALCVEKLSRIVVFFKVNKSNSLLCPP